MGELEPSAEGVPSTVSGRLGLRFRSARTERAFRRDYAKRVRSQTQAALATGAGAYLVLGLEDLWFFPDALLVTLAIRLAAFLAIILGLALTISPLWARHNQLIIGGVALLAGAGALALLALATPETANSYYFGLALTIIWTHTFSGLRVPASVVVSTCLLLGYAAVIASFHSPAAQYLVTNSLNLGVATAIAAVSGYVVERQRRLVFEQTLLLDAERRGHRQMALHDHLTGLPNRVSFEAAAAKALARAKRHARSIAVLFIDLDGFKKVNDELGHDAGDQVLAAVASALRETLRDSDTVARMGGDEFLVLLEDLHGGSDAGRVIRAVTEALGRTVAVRTKDGATRIVSVSASVGAAVSPCGTGLDELIRRADDAMYAAKTQGPGNCRMVECGEAAARA